MLKLVWDTSALVNIKEPNERGYSPGHSLWKDLADGWIVGPYKNIIPTIAAFEINAAVSRLHLNGGRMVRDFRLIGPNERLYDIDVRFMKESAELVRMDGFDRLRGADLIFACIASLEKAWLVTLDHHFEHVADKIKVIDLNLSKTEPEYYHQFPMQDDGEAQYNLGVAYATGRDLPQDYVQAHMCFNVAASRSTGEVRETSVKARDDLAAEMTPEQLAEAQRRAREWDAAHPREAEFNRKGKDTL